MARSIPIRVRKIGRRDLVQAKHPQLNSQVRIIHEAHSHSPAQISIGKACSSRPLIHSMMLRTLTSNHVSAASSRSTIGNNPAKLASPVLATQAKPSAPATHLKPSKLTIATSRRIPLCSGSPNLAI